MKLSILVCRLANRELLYQRLLSTLKPQLNDDVELLTLKDLGSNSIGTKRNALLLKATGDYVSFIDDDDRVSSNYIKEVMNGINQNVDCCSLVGEITTNGKNPKIFVHSIDYDHYFEKNEIYYRPPNHLNVIKRNIAIKYQFPRINHGEDTDWAMQLAKDKILKTEYKIKKTIYYYDYVSSK